MITKIDCWKLYLVALEEIEKAQGEKILFRNCSGGDVVNKIYQKAKELNL